MTISSILREILRVKEGRILLLLFYFSFLCLMGLMGPSIDYFSQSEIFMHIAESWAFAAYSHLKKADALVLSVEQLVRLFFPI